MKERNPDAKMMGFFVWLGLVDVFAFWLDFVFILSLFSDLIGSGSCSLISKSPLDSDVVRALWPTWDLLGDFEDWLHSAASSSSPSYACCCSCSFNSFTSCSV